MKNNNKDLDFDVSFDETPIEQNQVDSNFDFDFDEEEEELDFGNSTNQIEQSVYQEEQGQQQYYAEIEQENLRQEQEEARIEGQQVQQAQLQTQEVPEQNIGKQKKEKKGKEPKEPKESKKEKKVEHQDLQDLVMYVLIDKHIPGLLGYFRNYGLNVSRIFTNINEAKDAILMQVEPSRIVIVDTGTGRFSLVGSRKSIIDLLGVSDEDNKISVFYTDTVIKSEVSISEEVEGKQIDWIKFRSTADILATMLLHKKKENYVFDMEANDDYKPILNLDIKGIPFKDMSTIDLGLPMITVNEVSMHREGGDQIKPLQAYAVKY